MTQYTTRHDKDFIVRTPRENDAFETIEEEFSVTIRMAAFSGSL